MQFIQHFVWYVHDRRVVEISKDHPTRTHHVESPDVFPRRGEGCTLQEASRGRVHDPPHVVVDVRKHPIGVCVQRAFTVDRDDGASDDSVQHRDGFLREIDPSGYGKNSSIVMVRYLRTEESRRRRIEGPSLQIRRDIRSKYHRCERSVLHKKRKGYDEIRMRASMHTQSRFIVVRFSREFRT